MMIMSHAEEAKLHLGSLCASLELLLLCLCVWDLRLQQLHVAEQFLHRLAGHENIRKKSSKKRNHAKKRKPRKQKRGGKKLKWILYWNVPWNSQRQHAGPWPCASSAPWRIFLGILTASWTWIWFCRFLAISCCWFFFSKAARAASSSPFSSASFALLSHSCGTQASEWHFWSCEYKGGLVFVEGRIK